MNRVLLTVSGIIPGDIEQQIARGERPMPDYLQMAKTFGADLCDYALARKANGWFGKILEKIGGTELNLAWFVFRQRKQYAILFTDGEQIGIPLAMLLKFLAGKRRPKHLMITHILSVKKKLLFFDLFRIQSSIDQFFVYSSFQQTFIQERFHLPADQVFFTPFMVDDDFYTPEKATNAPLEAASPLPLLSSAGRERRDYATLIGAVRDLPVKVIIASASPWSKRADPTARKEIPKNVHIGGYSFHQLRDIYASSSFFIMPLMPVDFQAGCTAILEAMAMGKAVIVSNVPGQRDLIKEGETGLYVPPQDPAALRAAIQYLLDHPAEAERVGKNAREAVLRDYSLRQYVLRLNEEVARQFAAFSQASFSEESPSKA